MWAGTAPVSEILVGVGSAVLRALAAASVVVEVLHSVSVSTSSREVTMTLVDTRVVVTVDLTTVVVVVEYTDVDKVTVETRVVHEIFVVHRPRDPVPGPQPAVPAQHHPSCAFDGSVQQMLSTVTQVLAWPLL